MISNTQYSIIITCLCMCITHKGLYLIPEYACLLLDKHYSSVNKSNNTHQSFHTWYSMPDSHGIRWNTHPFQWLAHLSKYAIQWKSKSFNFQKCKRCCFLWIIKAGCEVSKLNILLLMKLVSAEIGIPDYEFSKLVGNLGLKSFLVLKSTFRLCESTILWKVYLRSLRI